MAGNTIPGGFGAAGMLVVMARQTAIPAHGITGGANPREITGEVGLVQAQGLGGMGAMTGIAFHHGVGHERFGIFLYQLRVSFVAPAAETGITVLHCKACIFVWCTMTFTSPG